MTGWNRWVISIYLLISQKPERGYVTQGIKMQVRSLSLFAVEGGCIAEIDLIKIVLY